MSLTKEQVKVLTELNKRTTLPMVEVPEADRPPVYKLMELDLVRFTNLCSMDETVVLSAEGRIFMIQYNQLAKTLERTPEEEADQTGELFSQRVAKLAWEKYESNKQKQQ